MFIYMCIYIYIPLFHKYLLCAYYVTSTVLILGISSQKSGSNGNRDDTGQWAGDRKTSNKK